MKQPTIRIAGGGIAGLTAAINLAREGFPVEVYERKKQAGGRFLGDLQGLENWTQKADVLDELKTMNVEINFDCAELPPLLLTDGQKRHLNFSFQRPLCYLVKRGTGERTLDQGLMQQCLDLGVTIHFGQAIAPDDARIIATGPRTREIFAIDKGIRFRTSTPDISVALVNDAAAYKGYSYLLITQGYGCMCNVMFGNFKAVNESFEKTREMLTSMVDIDIQDPESVGGIGSFSSQMTFRQGERLFVGEAAGLQDFLFGFGIRTAMQSGFLAAQSIIHGRDYEQMAVGQFEHLLRAGIVNRFLFEKFGNFRNAYYLMGKLVQSRSSSRDFLRKAYRFTPIHKIVYPLALSSMQRKFPDLKF